MPRTGRPVIIDNPAPPDRWGQDTGQTIADKLLDLVALGMDLNDVACTVGISRETIRDWRRQGAAARSKLGMGLQITDKEQRMADFSCDLESADVEAERVRVQNIRGVAQGGYVVVEVVEEFKTVGLDDDTNEPIEILASRKVTRRQMPPNWQADMTWLERRMPEKYRRRTEVTGADGAPLIPSDDEARQLAGELRAFQQGLEDAKSDAKTGG